MTTILFAFLSAFLLSLVLTPGARWLGVRFGAIDEPGERKVHTHAIPRSGGAVIFLSFFLVLFACTFLMTQVSNLLVWDDKILFGWLGAVVVFSVGFYDDFHRLGPKVKFLLQIVAASLAFYGGLRIEAFAMPGLGIHFGVMSYFITLFWFLLFINAVNLIDGLDGLAAGVGFFTSLVMVLLAIMRSDYLIALEFAALGGALLGFLRYNFNPASIFLGDGGSYFIGYAIAALSILGSIKSQVGATLLIPLLALGVPIFDTILSPLRRFAFGLRMFHPDKGHIHHRLLEMGFSSRKVVLLVYGITCALCFFAILLVNYRSEAVGLPLIILAVGSIVFTRKLGYLEYIAADKIYGWLQDMTDVSGLSRHRRSFLNRQMDIERSRNIDELWGNVCLALEMLHFDRGELHVNTPASKHVKGCHARTPYQSLPWTRSGVRGRPDPASSPILDSRLRGNDRRRSGKDRRRSGNDKRRSGNDRRRGGNDVFDIDKAENIGQFQLVERRQNNGRGCERVAIPLQLKIDTAEGDARIWTRGDYRRGSDTSARHFLKVEMPLANNGDVCPARLVLFKDIRKEPFQPFTLRRVEHLRRSVTEALTQQHKRGAKPPPTR